MPEQRMTEKRVGTFYYHGTIYEGTFWADEIDGQRDSEGGGKQLCLCNNHGCCDAEIKNMEECLRRCSLVAHGDAHMRGCSEKKLQQVQERLGRVLPKELWSFYSLVGEDAVFMANNNPKKRAFFLPSDALYLDAGKIVFYKRKGKPLALSLERRHVLFGVHKTWYEERMFENFCQVAVMLAAAFVCSHMAYQVKVRGGKRTDSDALVNCQQRLLAMGYYPIPGIDAVYHSPNGDGLAVCQRIGSVCHVMFGNHYQIEAEQFSILCGGRKFGKVKIDK